MIVSRGWVARGVVALAVAAGAGVCGVAGAAPVNVFDGIIDAAYGPAVKTYTNTSTVNTVSTFLAFDDTYVYGAVRLDSGASAPFSGANIYFYGTGAGTTYGDGDDLILEGSNGWGFGGPAGMLGAPQAYNVNVTYSYFPTAGDGVGSVAEFSIKRSLIGNYTTYRYGGQLFSYDFHTGGTGPSAGALVTLAAVPTPSAAMGGGALLALAGLRRRR